MLRILLFFIGICSKTSVFEQLYSITAPAAAALFCARQESSLTRIPGG
jgi:hypothetical protein